MYATTEAGNTLKTSKKKLQIDLVGEKLCLLTNKKAQLIA